MPAYDYECTKCGWKGTRYNVKIDERNVQKCDERHERWEDYPDRDPPDSEIYIEECDGDLKRSDEFPIPAVQVDASGAGFMGVSSSGQPIKGQFGGGHMQKRRFKP